MGTFFKRPLAFGAASRYAYPGVEHQNEHALLPTQTDVDDPTYPEEPGIENSPVAYRGNGTRLFQHSDEMPSKLGIYELGFRNDVGLTSELNSHIVPAPGSGNLNAPRDVGGIPGVNRIIASVGPVRGETYSAYRNVRQAGVTNAIGTYGPVVGGNDYAQALANAYYQQVNAAFDAAQAESAMVSAV